MSKCLSEKCLPAKRWKNTHGHSNSADDLPVVKRQKPPELNRPAGTARRGGLMQLTLMLSSRGRWRHLPVDRRGTPAVEAGASEVRNSRWWAVYGDRVSCPGSEVTWSLIVPGTRSLHGDEYLMWQVICLE